MSGRGRLREGGEPSAAHQTPLCHGSRMWSGTNSRDTALQSLREGKQELMKLQQHCQGHRDQRGEDAGPLRQLQLPLPGWAPEELHHQEGLASTMLSNLQVQAT